MSADATQASQRRFTGLVVAVLLVAALVRLVLILEMGSRAYFADTAEYERAARSLLAGQGIGPDVPRAPLYPALMALGFILFGSGNFVGVRLLQLLAGLGVVALTMRLGHRLGGRPGAALAGAAAALAPTLVFTTAMLYPTVLYTLLLLAATLAALELETRPRVWRAAWLGLAGVLMWLTDQVAVVPFAALLAWLAAGARGEAIAPWRKRAGAAAIALATTVLLAVPWVVAQKRATGHSAFLMEKAQIVLFYARTDPTLAGGRAVRDTSVIFHPLTTPQFVAREWRLFRDQPIPYVSDYVHEFVHFFQPMPDRITTRNAYTSSGAKLVTALFLLPVLVLGIVGLLLGGARRRQRWLLALVPVATAALYALFFSQMRYRIPTEPCLLVLAALGLARLFPRLTAALSFAPPPPGAPDAPPR